MQAILELLSQNQVLDAQARLGDITEKVQIFPWLKPLHPSGEALP